MWLLVCRLMTCFLWPCVALYYYFSLNKKFSVSELVCLQAMLFYVGEPFTPPEMKTEEPSYVSFVLVSSGNKTCKTWQTLIDQWWTHINSVSHYTFKDESSVSNMLVQVHSQDFTPTNYRRFYCFLFMSFGLCSLQIDWTCVINQTKNPKHHFTDSW